MTLFHPTARPGGAHGSVHLLPSDGGPEAERRAHPTTGEAFGAGVPARLRGMSDDLARAVGDACDANLGIGPRERP